MYAPHVAKLLAYADCSVQVMLTNKDPRLCACNRIIDDADIPMGDLPDKQKELSLKADWKYTSTDYYTMDVLFTAERSTMHPHYLSSFPSRDPGDIFQPPRA